MPKPRKPEPQPMAADASVEAALLSCVLQNAAVADDDRFAPHLFQNKDNAALAGVLSLLHAKGVPLNRANVLLESKDEGLAELCDKLTSRSLPGSPSLLIARLEEVGIRSGMAGLCRDFHEAAFNEEEDMLEALDRFEQRVMRLRPARAKNLHRLGDMREVLKIIKWRAANPGKIMGRPTGYDRFDLLTDGLMGGELIVIAARPSGGKTALISNMIESEVANGGIPLCYSLEMGDMSLKTRILAAVSRTPTGKMGRNWTKSEADALAKGIKTMSGWPGFIDDTERCDIRHIRRTTRKLVKEHGITSVWVDYLQLVRGVRKSSQTDRRYEVGEVTGELKAMAKELNLPVVVCCQIRRPTDIYDRVTSRTKHQRPELHHLKESGDIEQDADVVGLLDRDQAENATKADLIIAKNRNGPTGTVSLEYAPEQCRFRQAA